MNIINWLENQSDLHAFETMCDSTNINMAHSLVQSFSVPVLSLGAASTVSPNQNDISSSSSGPKHATFQFPVANNHPVTIQQHDNHTSTQDAASISNITWSSIKITATNSVLWDIISQFIHQHC